MTVVQELLKPLGEVYIVIDALDECEQAEEALRWIQELVRSKEGRLHLLISSRQNQIFRSVFESLATTILALHECTFEEDIKLYIREQLSTDPRMMKWPSSVHKTIEESLIINAGGLYATTEIS